MLNDPISPQPAVDGWFPIVGTDDDGRFVRIDVDAPAIAGRMQAGQFCQITPQSLPSFGTASVSTGWNQPLLNRPFSIHRWMRERNGFSFLLDRIGPGTRAIGMGRPGDRVRLIGPLGQGMAVPPKGKSRLVFAAGGIGVAPFDAFAEIANQAGITSAMAYGVGRLDDIAFRLGNRTRLDDEMARFGCTTYLASLSGETGFHGNVIELLDAQLERRTGCFAHVQDMGSTLVIGCGPWGMLRALAKWTAGKGLDCQVLLEEMMGCGYGVCRSCVVPGFETNAKGQTESCNITTCRHGPLVDASRIDWEGSIA